MRLCLKTKGGRGDLVVINSLVRFYHGSTFPSIMTDSSAGLWYSELAIIFQSLKYIIASPSGYTIG